MSGNPRRVRVAQSMRKLLADMLDREVKDPRVRAAGFIGVNHVQLNADMSVARVHVSFLQADTSGAGVRTPRIQDAMAGLQAAAGYLRGPLARRLNLRRAPSLQFIADDSPRFQQELRDLVREDQAARDRAELDTHDERTSARRAASTPASDATKSPGEPTG